MNLNPPSGTRDFLPAQVQARARLFRTLKQTLELFGFEPLDTPSFERLDTLVGKYGEEGEKLIFKILRRGEWGKQGDIDLALRYDLTVPLARVYSANKNDLAHPFKRYQMAPVWRADRPGKGRFREFYQCDFDVVGSASLLVEVEVIAALAESLHAIGLSGCKIHLSSRKVLEGLLLAHRVPEALKGSTMVALDKLDKIGVDGVVKELAERGLEAVVVEDLKSALTAQVSALDERIGSVPVGKEGLSDVRTILDLVRPILPEGSVVEFAPFLARGLDYYTGAIFEVFHPEFSGAIGSGGRYDNLIGTVAGQPTPACGGSIGVERVLMLLEQKAQGTPTPRCDVLVGIWDEGSRKNALELSALLRRQGIRAEVFLGEGNLSAQFKRAARQKIPCVVLRGPDEMAQNKVSIKFLEKGEQKTVSLEELVPTIQSQLKA